MTLWTCLMSTNLSKTCTRATITSLKLCIRMTPICSPSRTSKRTSTKPRYWKVLVHTSAWTSSTFRSLYQWALRHRPMYSSTTQASSGYCCHSRKTCSILVRVTNQRWQCSEQSTISWTGTPTELCTLTLREDKPLSWPWRPRATSSVVLTSKS